MSKDIWFDHFERIEAEHPEKNYDEIGEMAWEAWKDGEADKVDKLHDEMKEGLHEKPST